MRVIEKFLFKKIQKHETQKTFIEMQLTQFVSWFRRRCRTMKFPHQSLRIFFLIRENKIKHTLSLKKWIWKLIRCCQRNRKVLFRINEHPIENVVLPNKPLSNFEIEDAVKNIGLKNFRGVFLRDTLPKKPKRNE